MNERIDAGELLNIMGEKTDEVLKNEAGDRNVAEAKEVIDRHIDQFVERGGFESEKYKDPISGILADFKEIESQILLEVTQAQFASNLVDFESAHKDGAMCAFLLRQKLVEAFVKKCEETPQQGSNGNGPSGEGFSKKSAEYAVLAHFALSLVELNEEGAEFLPKNYTKEAMFKSEMFGLLVDYGIRQPDKVERLIFDVRGILLSERRAFEKAINERTFQRPDKVYYPEQTKQEIEDATMYSYKGLVRGLRAELISYAICNRVLVGPDRKTVIFGNGMNLEVDKASLEDDAFYDVDLVVKGLVNGKMTTLVGIDIVTERSEDIADDDTFKFAVTYPVPIADGRYKAEVDGDDLVKEVTSRTKGFVRTSGIPVVSIRIPPLYLDDRFLKGNGLRNNLLIGWGYCGTEKQQKDVNTSADLLDYSIRYALETSLKVKHAQTTNQ